MIKIDQSITSDGKIASALLSLYYNIMIFNPTLKLGSGYFAVDSNLPLELILPQSFTCVYIAIFAIITPVTLWCSE